MADVILVTHSVHSDILEDDARAALPPDLLVRACVDIRPARLTFDETASVDWVLLAREQKAQWIQKVVPLLERYPGAHIAYFGLAPIPLAIHLGSLTERWLTLHVFQRSHTQPYSWKYPGGPVPNVTERGMPREMVHATNPAIVMIGTTSIVDSSAALALVGPTAAEIVLQAEPPGEDVLCSEDAVRALGEHFHRALTSLESNRPGVDELHLFGAIPCGLAFLLGSYITPTRHARIVTYQYHRAHEPRLREALRLPERSPAAIALTASDIEAARTLRGIWEDQCQALATFVAAQHGAWWTALGTLGDPFSNGAFGKLDAAKETPLMKPIDLTDAAVPVQFRFDIKSQTWRMSEGLVHIIQRYVPSDIERAGRLLLLHEALHHGAQRLTSSSAIEIRFAPKALEEIDYLADTWGILHNFAFEGFIAKPWPEQRSGLLESIETAINTMWAFDEDRERGQLEVRRINRYVNWYVILGRIERAMSAADAMTILSEKPVVDLIGPVAVPQDGRLMARLDGQGMRTYELCMLDRRGRLRRFGGTNATSVAQLAVALGNHEGSRIRELVRDILEQLGDADV